MSGDGKRVLIWVGLLLLSLWEGGLLWLYLTIDPSHSFQDLTRSILLTGMTLPLVIGLPLALLFWAWRALRRKS
jgi:hypothetical protein